MDSGTGADTLAENQNNRAGWQDRQATNRKDLDRCMNGDMIADGF